MSASVVTSLALSAVLHGRIGIKDLLYSPICGAILVGTSAQVIFNPMAAIILGIIAGFLQPLFNIVEQRLAKGQIYFCTSAPFLFLIQGLLGGMAAGIMRVIKYNNSTFDHTIYPYPYRSLG
jgi:ammonia channel protein AmtB